MRKTLLRAGVVPALALALTCLPAGTASADTGLVVTVGGNAVSVGTVVDSGQLVDGICRFDNPQTIRLAGSSSSGTARVTALDDCRLVVTLIDTAEHIVPTAGSAAPSRVVAKRDPRFWLNLDAVPASTSVGLDGLGGYVDTGGVDIGSVGSAASGSTYHGATVQRFYGPTGLTEWEDQVAFAYHVTGGTYDAYSITGSGPSYCGVYDTTDAVATPNTTDADDCRMTRPVAGDSYAQLEGWGRYYQQALTNELYPTGMWERFLAYGKSSYTGECTRDAVPPGWSVDCSYSRSTVATL